MTSAFAKKHGAILTLCTALHVRSALLACNLYTRTLTHEYWILCQKTVQINYNTSVSHTVQMHPHVCHMPQYTALELVLTI